MAHKIAQDPKSNWFPLVKFNYDLILDTSFLMVSRVYHYLNIIGIKVQITTERPDSTLFAHIRKKLINYFESHAFNRTPKRRAEESVEFSMVEAYENRDFNKK